MRTNEAQFVPRAVFRALNRPCLAAVLVISAITGPGVNRRNTTDAKYVVYRAVFSMSIIYLLFLMDIHVLQ